VDLLANTEKLITEDRRWRYEDGGLEEDDKSKKDKPNQFIPIPEAKQEVKLGIFNKKVDVDNKKGDNNDNVSGQISEIQKKSGEVNLSGEELMLQKLDVLRKLAELAQAGVKLSQ